MDMTQALDKPTITKMYPHKNTVHGKDAELQYPAYKEKGTPKRMIITYDGDK